MGTFTSNIPFKKNNKIATKVLSGFFTAAGMTSPGYDGKTYQTIFTAETNFYAVRLILRNSLATSYLVDSAAVAVSDAYGINPSTGAAGWVPITWAGVSSVTVPARIAEYRPSVIKSDWINIKSIARADGSSLPTVYFRAFNTTGPKTGLLGTSSHAEASWRTQSALNKNRFVIHDSATGDFVTANQQSMTTDSGNFGAFISEFEYLSDKNIISVMGCGDSITNGDGSTIKCLGWGHMGCYDLSTTDRPISWVNHGFSSQLSPTFLSRLIDAIDGGIKPDIVVYSPFSPNDGSATQAIIDAQLMNLYRAISVCDDNDIKMIVSTPCPRGYAATPEGFRQSLCQTIRTMASNRIFTALLDFDAVLASTPGGNSMGSLTTDGLHPNYDGYVVAANEFKRVLSKIIGI